MCSSCAGTFVTGRGATPNENTATPPSVGPGARPGDPDGLVLEGEDTFSGELAAIHPSPWDGWPAHWNVPSWGLGGHFDNLVDTAWTCIDLNASVLASMPVLRVRDGTVIDPTSWMAVPDPSIYASWDEFAKQLFWDFQLGEAFVLSMARGFDGKPLVMRVIPPWMVNVELLDGFREYRIGGMNVTGDMLHIRYKSTIAEPHGHGPLESGRTRLVAAGVLAHYATEVARGGGIPHYVIEVPQRMTRGQVNNLLDQWWHSRTSRLGQPAVITGGGKVQQVQLSPQDIGLTDLAQFNESRIAVMLGVPPFLVGLPSGGDSMTYSNVSSLFDFHDRASLRPKARAVMSALGNWALARGQALELNRDEYSRPAFNERAEAYERLAGIIDSQGRSALSVQEIRTMERLHGDTPRRAAAALTGGE